MTYHYRVKFKNSETWELDVEADTQLAAGVQVWEKIKREGRAVDVQSVYEGSDIGKYD